MPTTSAKEKPPQDLATEDEQRQHGQKSKSGGEDGSAQRLVDAAVDQIRQWLAAAEAQILANAVKDDDGVVHRVADEGQDGGDDGEGDFHDSSG